MKRKHGAPTGGRPCKKARRTVDQSAPATPSAVEHPVLRRLYPQVLTLRQYLLVQLPRSSKNRRRKLDQIGRPTAAHNATSPLEVDVEVGRLLDSALVTTLAASDGGLLEHETKQREQEIQSFTQQRSPGTAGGTFKPGYLLQSEVRCTT